MKYQGKAASSHRERRACRPLSGNDADAAAAAAPAAPQAVICGVRLGGGPGGALPGPLIGLALLREGRNGRKKR